MAYNVGPNSRTGLGDSEENSDAIHRRHEGQFHTEYTGSSEIGTLENLLPYVSKFWAHLISLGTALGIEDYTLAIVQGNQSVEVKCHLILNRWLIVCPIATWKMFCDALKKYDQAFADVRMQIQRDHRIDQQTMQPSTTPVEDQRTLALRKAHMKLKRYYCNTRPAKGKQFVNLALVKRPSTVDKTKKDVKEFLEATAHGIDRYTAHQKTIEYDTILASTGSDSGKHVLISGSPGSGKTTLAHKLCRDLYSGHLPNQYQLVLFTELKAFRSYTNKKNKEASLHTLLEYLGLPETDSLCSMIEKEEGRGVAIILDGYDEISDGSCKTLAEWVSDVFCDAPLLKVRECDVFITTRPSQLSQLTRDDSVHLEILGFSSSDIECYIKDYFKGSPDIAEEVIRRLTGLHLVRGLCSNPRTLEVACKILMHQDEEPLPANLSGIFLRYLCYQLEVDLAQRQPPVETGIKDLFSIPEELFPGFYPLCSLAYKCCLRQRLMLEKQELGEVKYYISSRGSVYNLLFGEEVDSPSEMSCLLYQCDHKAVMEALAAVHIAVLSPAEQQQIWEEWLTAPHMAQVWMMYCGLTGLKSVDLRGLCSLTVSERSREVVKDLDAATLYTDEDQLVMVSLFEASNDEEASRVLPVLLKNTIRGYVKSQHNVLCLAYSITHHPHLSRVELYLSAYFSELDLKPLTTSLKNVKAVELRCFQIEPMLAVLPRAVEELSLDFDLKVSSSAKGNVPYKGLGDALRDCHCLRSLTINSPPDSALWTELDSVLNSNRLTEFHMEDIIYDPPSMETLKNLLVHREKCSLTMDLTDPQLSVLLSGLKRADKLKELDLQITPISSEVNLDQWACAEVEEVVATHPHLVKVKVKSYYSYKGDLLIAVAKGAIRNKNITHLGLGRDETRAVHPLLCSPSADHITSIRAEYDYYCDDDDDDDDDGDDDDDDDAAWSKGVIVGPMARQTCDLDLWYFTPSSSRLLLSRVNTATKLKDLSLEVSYIMDNEDEDQPLMDVRAVETAFSICCLRKLRIKHYKPPAQWCCLYSAILNGLAANTTAQVDSCIYGQYFDVEEITRHLSQQTLQRFEVVRTEDWTYIISRDPSCPSAPVPAPGPLLNTPSQPTSPIAKSETTPTHQTTPPDPPPTPPDVGELLRKHKDCILSDVMSSPHLQMEEVISGEVPREIKDKEDKKGNCLIYKHLMEQGDLKSLQTFGTVLVEEEGNAKMQRLGKDLLDHQSLQKFEVAKSFDIISRDPSCPSGHELVLLDKCFIPFGIKTVQINQSGGVYNLEPTTDGVEDPHSDDIEQQRSGGDDDEGTQLPEGTDGDGEGKGIPLKSTDISEGREEENRFKIEVSDGALKQKCLEVRSAIIFSGPWRLPEGYTLASPVLYISFDCTAVTKPITVRVPHWIAQVSSLSAEDCPLVTAPHDLPEDDTKYTFSFLDQESCSVGAQYSTIKLSGHCCLLAQAIKKSKGKSRYSATAWTRPQSRESLSGYLFRVTVIFSVTAWNEILEKYFGGNNWTRCWNIISSEFEFATGKLSGTLPKESGPGWTASLNCTRLPKSLVQCREKADTLKDKLEHDDYPPSFVVTVNECSREQDTESMFVSLVVSGTNLGSLTFPFPVKQAVHLSEAGSLPSLRSPPTASRNDSPMEGPHSSPGDAPIEDVAFFLAYTDEMTSHLVILKVVLGLSSFTPPGDSPSDKCFNTLMEWLKRTTSPTVGKFCKCLEKAPSFNHLRETILPTASCMYTYI